MIRDSLRVSPQQLDPLSWMTRPAVSLGLATIVLLYGGASTLLTWSLSQRPYLDLIAIVLMFAAVGYVNVATRPLRPAFTPLRAIAPIVLALTGLALSAVAGATSAVGVENWWAPVGLGIFVATCGPYSTVIAILSYGVVLTTATGIAAWGAFVGRDDPWSGLAAIVIAISSVVVGTLATATFSFVVVRRTQRLLRRAGIPAEPDDALVEEAARRADINTLARLGSRVAPFLAEVAEAGVVSHETRALAGQLARRLRSDLVSHANRSWLDSLSLGGHIYIVDPDHRANSMNAAQRTALHGLLLAVVKDPATDSGSLFIEMRGRDDGSTAVALSFDLDLPEGRRVMMLAPHFVALRSTVNEISWDPSHDLLKFQVPPGRTW